MDASGRDQLDGRTGAQSSTNTLNKHIYGRNNPLKYLDPDGKDEKTSPSSTTMV